MNQTEMLSAGTAFIYMSRYTNFNNDFYFEAWFFFLQMCVLFCYITE